MKGIIVSHQFAFEQSLVFYTFLEGVASIFKKRRRRYPI